MNKVHIKSKEVVSNDHAVLQKVKYTIENGKESREQTREVYDHGDAAAALLYDPANDKILLTRQFRLPTYLNGNPSGELLEVCAGLVEKSESPETTMKREILEETGYQVDKLEKIGQVYSSSGVLTELVHLFIATYSCEQKKSNGGGLKEEGENITLIELDARQAISMLVNGEIRDAKTIILLQHFALQKQAGHEQY